MTSLDPNNDITIVVTVIFSRGIDNALCDAAVVIWVMIIYVLPRTVVALDCGCVEALCVRACVCVCACM
jgi:hypothetical protein